MKLPRVPVPRWLIYTGAIAVVLSWLPLVLALRARNVPSAKPRIHLLQDMGNQPKYLPQDVNRMFADGRAMRPDVPGTVARGDLRDDEAFYRGRVGEQWVDVLPVAVTEQLVRYGQQRFNIFCATCHGLDGGGAGPTHQRAVKLQEARWVPPTSLTSDTVRERPVGHVYNTITHGIRNMASYGEQIPPTDRWAIVAYIEALQLSQHASIEDVPADRRDALR